MFWHSGPQCFQHLRMALYRTIPSRRKLLFVRFDRSNSCTDHSVFGHPIWHLLGYRGATCCCLFLVLSIIHSPGGGTTLPEKEREPRLRTPSPPLLSAAAAGCVKSIRSIARPPRPPRPAGGPQRRIGGEIAVTPPSLTSSVSPPRRPVGALYHLPFFGADQ